MPLCSWQVRGIAQRCRSAAAVWVHQSWLSRAAFLSVFESREQLQLGLLSFTPNQGFLPNPGWCNLCRLLVSCEGSWSFAAFSSFCCQAFYFRIYSLSKQLLFQLFLFLTHPLFSLTLPLAFYSHILSLYSRFNPNHPMLPLSGLEFPQPSLLFCALGLFLCTQTSPVAAVTWSLLSAVPTAP